ncbi:MAG: penicillin-binding protein 2 [Candidatus Omnitrophica bacterium CG1_02_46_14]|nr:MAG: penicillin-binding protein 2 [Candidatus Omnitrophica bacterium CG1_02_46_14]
MKANRLSIIILIGFLVILANLIRMQIILGDYYRTLSEKNRIRVIYLEGPRGKILDRRANVLASSRLSFNCSVVPREARSKIHESCKIVGAILGVDPEDLEKRYQKKKQGVFNTIILAEDIRSFEAIAIEEKLDLLPGFMIETRPQREYPYGNAAAHLIGYLGPMGESEIDDMESYGYRQMDWLGREGIEKTYESYLRGQSGGLQIEVDSRGRLIRALGVKEPQEGKDLELTIDAKLQSRIQELLKDQKGAVIVMELGEGGLLAVNSSPSFDPNLFASAKGRKEVGKYLHDSTAPMVNRGVRGQFPPGSIFKVITALAALENHKVSPRTTFYCPGYMIVGGNRFRCWTSQGHGNQALSEAFAHSCDVFFYSTGLLAGVDAIYEKCLAFGLSKPTGIDLPSEKSGFVPSRNWKREKLHRAWFEGDTANLSIGQGYLQITPIQALVMIAAIATSGELFKPHLVNKISGVKVAERNIRPVMIASRNWEAVKEGLDQVVNSNTGTGRLARAEGLHIAGKTGSAESGGDKTHAWFVGYAPLEHPKVAMVVFLEHGGHGGISAARIASTVFTWLKESAYV